jgi:hypothetical protein
MARAKIRDSRQQELTFRANENGLFANYALEGLETVNQFRLPAMGAPNFVHHVTGFICKNSPAVV